MVVVCKHENMKTSVKRTTCRLNYEQRDRGIDRLVGESETTQFREKKLNSDHFLHRLRSNIVRDTRAENRYFVGTRNVRGGVHETNFHSIVSIHIDDNYANVIFVRAEN